MAKRKRLEAPNPDDLKDLEAGFARETPVAGPMGLRPAPIAQVAADAASRAAVGSVEDRAARARDSADAEKYRKAMEQGLVIADLPVAEIVADELTRDRMALQADELEELKSSIAAHGLRLPVEVFELTDPDAGARYGLISGYRRLVAIKALLGDTGHEKYTRIRAIIRRPGDLTAAYVAMVEENEIRADLSQYERGRIAVLAVGQGAFPSIEAAVDGLFGAGSKAKRSKIRSFALIHEELGDMLNFPTALSERAGLRIAAALRDGFAAELRAALATGQGVDADAEWAAMEPTLRAAEAQEKDGSRGGRPKTAVQPKERTGRITLANGIEIEKETGGQGFAIRFHGKAVDADLIDTVMLEIQRLLEKV